MDRQHGSDPMPTPTPRAAEGKNQEAVGSRRQRTGIRGQKTAETESGQWTEDRHLLCCKQQVPSTRIPKDKLRRLAAPAIGVEEIMSSVTIEEAQAKLPQLIDQLTPGEEMVITRQGRPCAQVKKTGATSWPCKAGSYRKAEFWMAPDFDAPLDDF